MCYGMCPHENSWGECRGGRHCECPLPTVMESHPVDLYDCEEAPSSLVSVWLEDSRYGDELHCYYDRTEGIWNEGEEDELEPDEARRGVVLALWRDAEHEEILRWPGRPEWAKDDEDGEDGDG